jgi:hypothetical protein
VFYCTARDAGIFRKVADSGELVACAEFAGVARSGNLLGDLLVNWGGGAVVDFDF